jgi:hypothetical protein
VLIGHLFGHAPTVGDRNSTSVVDMTPAADLPEL